MKKLLLVICVGMTLYSALRIVQILVRDLDRLTNFGYGYLAGQVILFFVFLFASLWLGRKIFRQNQEAGHNRP